MIPISPYLKKRFDSIAKATKKTFMLNCFVYLFLCVFMMVLIHNKHLVVAIIAMFFALAYSTYDNYKESYFHENKR